MKFHHWCYLNDEGKTLYGVVFPDGIVPVKVMIPQKARLEGELEVQQVYKIDWNQLTDKQQDQILEITSKKFDASKQIIRKQFEKDGFIPLRGKYVSGAGTDQMGLFM